MARSNDGCFGIFGAIVIIILVIVETFKGNFIPIFVIMGIFLLFKIFIWWSELKPKNDQIIIEKRKETNYGPYLLGTIILGGLIINFYFKTNHRSINIEPNLSAPYPISQPLTTNTEIPKEAPKKILWAQKYLAILSFKFPRICYFKQTYQIQKAKCTLITLNIFH